MKHRRLIGRFCGQIFFVLFCSFSFAQQPSFEAFNKYVKSSGDASSKFNKRIDKANAKYLKKYFKQENKLHKKLCKKNPALADHLFSYSVNPLFHHQNDATNVALLKNRTTSKEYFPRNDTLQCSLDFLEKNKDKFQGLDEKKLSSASVKAKALDQNLSQSDKLHQYFRQRKVMLKESLSKYPELKNSVKGYDKVNYYYHEQIAEYKKLFSNPAKVEESAMKILRGNSSFKQFMEKNGMLSKFGKIPSDWGKSLEGLQTITQTKDLMDKSISALGSNPKDIIEKKMEPMQQTMGKLKSGNYGNVSNAADVPDFKPNPLKSKRFIDRLEFGTNFQVNQSNTFYPVTANMGVQVAYKLTTRISPGIGISYMIGLGKNWNNIHLSHQGIGLRSFVDLKLYSILFIEGGYEKNYKQEIKSIEQLKDKKYWQNSALAGLKLKYKIGGKYGASLALLYDFMYEEHYPASQPLVYRVGCEF